MNPMDALAIANERKEQRKAIKRALKRGEIKLVDVIRAAPDVILDTPLIDMIRWQRQVGVKRLMQINERAIDDGINLATSLASAPHRTRTWALENL